MKIRKIVHKRGKYEWIEYLASLTHAEAEIFLKYSSEWEIRDHWKVSHAQDPEIKAIIRLHARRRRE